MTAILELRNVSKIYRSGFLGRNVTGALDDISLRIEENRPTITAIVGESGSGKTTLASLLLGFTAPTSGMVLYRGKEVHRLSGEEQRRFRREVQAIFQDPFAAYNPFYTIDHVLTVPIARFGLARSKREARRLMEEALTGVGLRPEETLGRFPHQLSGGQRQRIIVARAMLLKPKVIIADEPVSMVDASLRATILEAIYKLHREYGVSVLYITHDLTTAYHIGHQIVVLYRGSVMEAGDVETLVQNPLHPYTRLLIDSVPWPDPDRRWGQVEVRAQNGDAALPATRGCKFAGRCPFVMPKCRASPPPLFQVTGTRSVAESVAPTTYAVAPPSSQDESTAARLERAVACYLHESAPALGKEALPDLLARVS
jgi:oligopeptide/dipeptide ABC transporter ATP-binding protein